MCQMQMKSGSNFLYLFLPLKLWNIMNVPLCHLGLIMDDSDIRLFTSDCIRINSENYIGELQLGKSDADHKCPSVYMQSGDTSLNIYNFPNHI